MIALKFRARFPQEKPSGNLQVSTTKRDALKRLVLSGWRVEKRKVKKEATNG
jgi:hypothetical protein